MAITEFQKEICRLIASTRKAQGVSCVAGAVALNELIQSPRISRDIDIFHDLAEAVSKTWESDRDLLTLNGYSVEVVRIHPSFAEAVVRKAKRSVLMQWAADSAYRFFPLVEDDTFGLTLHPFDLATNKVLAMAGRLEARDWIDSIYCHQQVQNYGYLVWAACSKDPGYSPTSLLHESKRSSRYSAAEIAQLAFTGPVPDAAELGRQWHGMLREAAEIIQLLPAEQAGTCVLDRETKLFRGGPAVLADALSEKTVLFHAGTIGGAFPKIVDEPS